MGLAAGPKYWAMRVNVLLLVDRRRYRGGACGGCVRLMALADECSKALGRGARTEVSEIGPEVCDV